MGEPAAQPGEIILGEKFRVNAVGFLTALVKTEMMPLTRALAQQGWLPNPVTPLLSEASITGWRKTIGGLTRYAFAMSFNTMGQTLAAVEVMSFLTRCQPSLVYLCGIAGSLNEKSLKIGDVVVGTAVHWQQQDKVMEVDGELCDVYRPKKFILRNNLDEDKSRAIETFVAETYGSNPLPGTMSSVQTGEIFTWDYVLSSKRRTKAILETYGKAVCVEMEAGGYMKAVERHVKVNARRSIESIVVRGISDYAGAKVKVPESRQMASANAALVTLELAEWMLHPDNIERWMHLE